MAFRELLLFLSLLLPIIFVKFTLADTASLPESAVVLQDQNGDVSQANAADLEIRQLNSKIASIESKIEDQTGELERKDGCIEQLEKVIEERSNNLASLQSAIRSLQENDSSDLNELVGEVNRRVNELEKQIVRLKWELEAQNKKKEELEAQVNVTEEKIEGLNLKYQNLQKTNDEQKSRICNARGALKMAEEEMMKAKLEVSSITKQIKEVYQGWLPHWLSVHLIQFQSYVTTHWNEHGRPALDLTIQNVLKHKSEVENWAQPHFETIRTEWFPTVEKHCKVFLDDLHSVVQSLSTEAIGYYHVTHSIIKPYLVKIEEVADPYFQETKMLMEPYIYQLSEMAKPHLDKARLCLKPYAEKLVRYHKKITKNVHIYHSLAQANIHQTLKSYELTKPLAIEGLVWFMASSLMALPMVVLFRILLRKKSKKRPRRRNRTHARHKAKWVHPDKCICTGWSHSCIGK